MCAADPARRTHELPQGPSPRRPGDQPDPLHRRAAGDRDLPDGDHHLQQVHLQVTLPTADAQKALEQPFEINVAIDASGATPSTTSASARDAQGCRKKCRPQCQRQQADPVIIINADALATHQTVVNVMEAARLAGYPKLTFAAQSSSK
jgi:biopolymer transport protein ExbD